MVTRRVQKNETDGKRVSRATTPEAREDELVALAVDLVERQMLEGTASSQVITHFLKLGSSREKLEQERLRIENSLNHKKIEILESQKRVEELYDEALDAMRSYAGQITAGSDDEEQFDD